MLAALIASPELMLTEEESERLAVDVSRVNDLYDGLILSEKSQAWLALAFTAGSIYGPRAIAIVARAKKEKQRKPNLVSMPDEVVTQ